MRLAFAALLGLPCLVFGQQPPEQHQSGVWDEAFRFAMDSADIASGKSLFEVAKTDVIVQVTKHQYGADMFEITAVQPNYPADLLRKQVTAMCDLGGTPARGLAAGNIAMRGEPGLYSTRATFATNGIIDREKGTLRIGPIVQAFAGAPAPFTVHGMMILFNGEQPTPNVLRTYRTPGIRLQAVALQNPPQVEYRVQLLSQDPKLLQIPETPEPEQKPLPSASIVQRNGVDWLTWVALLAGAGAAGFLVYFLMLRLTAKPGR
jgi:hypothetical protein